VQAKEKGLELTFSCNCEKDDRTIYCDPDRLRELLVNLVNNAIKFTETGSVEIKCRTLHGENMVALEVIDTGAGIEPDRQKELFDPFAQVDGKQHGGAGLGLTIAKKFVEMMGGRISIQSKGLGHGTKVTVTLPQTPPSNQ
jgi:signal transduction histidine kinase